MEPEGPPSLPGYRLVYVDEINNLSPMLTKLYSQYNHSILWLINGWIEGVIDHGRNRKVVTDNERTF